MSFFLFNNQPDALIFQLYSVIKLHVSGNFSVHHQEFSTVQLALVRFMHVFFLMKEFYLDSVWKRASKKPT
jgi:hypothetical protein